MGGGGHAKSVIACLKDSLNTPVLGYTDVSNRGPLLGLPYLGDESLLPELPSDKCIIGVSYGQSPLDRGIKESIVQNILNRGGSFENVLAISTLVHDTVCFGEGMVALNFAVVNCGVSIGSHALLNTCSVVEHDCSIGDYFTASPGSIVCGDCSIGDRVFLGAGVIVRDGISIVSDVTIGAGGLVVSDIREPGLYIGVPVAKVRDKDSANANDLM